VTDWRRAEPLFPNAAIVGRREYGERLRSRTFHASTVVLAAFAVLVAFVPLFARAIDRQTTTRVGIVAVDPALAQTAIGVMSSVLNSQFAGGGGAKPYVRIDEGVARGVRRRAEAGELDGALTATRAQDGGIDFNFYTSDSLGADRTQLVAIGTLAVGILDWTANNTVTGRQFRMPTLDITAASGPNAGGSPLSGSDFAGRRIVAIVLLVLIFLMVVIYGMWVAAGVVQEKTSRVMELMVATIKPRALMTGKILGVGAVGLTQLAFWYGSGALLGIGMAVQIKMVTGSLDIPVVPLALFPVFFLLGYFLYAALWAMLGAMVNSEQEAQQTQFFVIFPLFVSLILMGPTITNPNSGLAVGVSLIPFCTPLLMYVRIAAGDVPVWQIALGIALMLGAIWVTLIVASRIYRVGILMYGKKPTLPEIVKWIKYA